MLESLAGSTRELRIGEVCTRFLTAEVSDGIAMSFAPLRQRSMAIVELITEDGLVGRGESWINYPPWAIDERRATLTQGVTPLLIGQDAADPAALRSAMLKALLPLGRQWGAPGPIMQAVSAVDVALWDLIGKASHTNVADLAGGRVRDSISVYASSIGPTGLAAQAEHCLAIGLSSVKVKIGFGRSVDEQNLRTARAVLGDDATLMADANQAWSLDDALEMAPILREVDVAWVEEPLRGDRVDELAELHRRTGLTIATGENLYLLDGFADYIAAPEIGVLQPDVSKTGGLSETIAISREAGKHGKAVLPHLFGGALAYAATLQLAACAPEVRQVEYDIRHNPLRDPLLTKPPRLIDGHVEIPTGPGLGVDLDPDQVAKYENRTGGPVSRNA